MFGNGVIALNEHGTTARSLWELFLKIFVFLKRGLGKLRDHR